MKDDPADKIRHWIKVRTDTEADDWCDHYPDFEKAVDAIIVVLNRHRPYRGYIRKRVHREGQMVAELVETPTGPYWCEGCDGVLCEGACTPNPYPCGLITDIATALGIEP